MATVRRVARRLEPFCMATEDACELLELVLEGEKLLGGMKTRLVRRLRDVDLASPSGERNLAEWLAKRSGTSVGKARDIVDSATNVEPDSATDDALRDGEISPEQANEIGKATRADPNAERDLLDHASTDGFSGTRDRSRRVRDAATDERDKVAREQRVHANRYHRRWTDAEGAACGSYRMTAKDAANFWAQLDAERDRIYKEARSEGRRDGSAAYEADALCALAERDARSHRGKRVTAILHADISALLRGHTRPGDTCEIPGVGTVSLTAARELLGDAILKVVLSDGVAVRTVVHTNRTVASTIRTALLWQHRECSVAGCHNVHGLQAHHTEDYAETLHTKLDELCLLCPFHHALVTHDGFTLEPRSDGQYELVPSERSAGARPQRAPPRAA